MTSAVQPPVPHPNRNLVVAIICLGSFLSPLSMASFTVAIPAMAAALQADAVSVSLLPTVFLLSNVALMLPCAKLADNIGRKRVYTLGIAINACASMAAFAAPDIGWILFLRFIQGAGSAMIFSTSLAIITAVFPANERGLPMGLNTAAVYLGLTMAPAMGGLITDSFGWRAVFLLPVPLSAALLALICSRMPGEWRHERYSPFDWTGATIFAGWSIALVIGLAGLPAWPSVLALLLSLVLFTLFIWQQSRNDEPLIRVQLFRENRLFSLSLATASLMYASTYSLAFLLSLYLQYVRGLTALQAGQVILVQAIAMALLAPFAGRLSDSVEPRVISTLGCLCCAAGFALLSQVGFDSSTSYIVTCQFIMGIGFGLFSTPNNNAVMSSVDARDIGVASATVNLARVSGNLVGISLVNLLVHHLLGDRAIDEAQYPALLATVNLAMTFSIGLALAATLVSAARGRTAPSD